MAFPLSWFLLFQYNGRMSVLLEQRYQVPSRVNCQWAMLKKRAVVRVAIFSAVQHYSLVT
ncbi:hypothetical protein [Rhizobium leguminosarum]|uniref:hypothetical protein n=1 Tax=Rhizobium leguminosarum TaxID=384 RepID=UPI003F9503D5